MPLRHVMRYHATLRYADAARCMPDADFIRLPHYAPSFRFAIRQLFRHAVIYTNIRIHYAICCYASLLSPDAAILRAADV